MDGDLHAATQFWKDNTDAGLTSQAQYCSVSFPIALFALVVFRQSNATNRLEAFNDKQKENSLRIAS